MSVNGYLFSQTNAIADTGKVGIGTTNPNCHLDVRGSTHVAGEMTIDSAVVISDSLRVENLRISGSGIFGEDVDVGRDILFKRGMARMTFSPSTATNGTDLMYLSKQAPPGGGIGIFTTCTNPANYPGFGFVLQDFQAIYSANLTGGYNVLAMQTYNTGASIDLAGNNNGNKTALLLNYFCGNDVALCTGTGSGGGSGMAGGVVSTGPNVEIGFPQRDMQVNLNVSGTDKTVLQLAGNYTTNSTTNYLNKWFINQPQSNVLGVFDATQNYKQVFTVKGDGKLGINRINPVTSLEVESDANGVATLINTNTSIKRNNLILENHSELATALLVLLNKNGTITYPFYVEGSGKTTLNVNPQFNNELFVINNSSIGKPVFQVNSAGSTFIGQYRYTGNAHSNALLSVSGKTITQSLYVIRPTIWSDFVFNSERENLNIVGEFISENCRLPGLPSEGEIMNFGYDVNEIDAKLLEKIERLYLHLIELNERIKKIEVNIKQ